MGSRERLWDHVPEILMALAYFPCGAFLAILCYSFTTIELTYEESDFIWALLVAIPGALLSAVALTAARNLSRRIVWLHAYLVATGCILFLVAGLYMMSRVEGYDYYYTCLLGGLGHGMIYISGLSYIHLRTKIQKYRVAKTAICHLFIMIGFVSSLCYISGRLFVPRWYHMLGDFLIYSSASLIGLLLLNELLHALGLYNYKKCLESELHEADEKRDRLKSALNIPTHRRNTAKQNALSVVAIFSKLINGFFFSCIFILLSSISLSYLVSPFGVPKMSQHLFAGSGVVLSILCSLFMRINILYPVVLMGQIAMLASAAVCWTTENYATAAVFFWLFYLLAGAGLPIPDVAIMEVSNVSVLEINLFFGFLLEQIPIVIGIFFVREEPYRVINYPGPLWYHASIFFGIAAFLVLLYGLGYPKTRNMNLLSIQRLILFNHKGPVPATAFVHPVIQYPTQGLTYMPVMYAPGPTAMGQQPLFVQSSGYLPQQPMQQQQQPQPQIFYPGLQQQMYAGQPIYIPRPHTSVHPVDFAVTGNVATQLTARNDNEQIQQTEQGRVM